jgi:hypothetical protein
MSTIVFYFVAMTAVLGVDDPVNSYHKGWVPLTCKLAYYAQVQPSGNTNGNSWDIRLTVPIPGRANVDVSSVDGVIMEVITPKGLAGQIICIWLDPPAVFSGGVRFKPGLVYAGEWRREPIGKLAFKGEVPFVPVAEPGGPANGSSRFAQRQIERHRRLAPVALP